MPIEEGTDGPYTPEEQLVILESFMAVPMGKVIGLAWETASEIDNAGFNIWRARKNDAGEYIDIVKLTNTSIPTQGVAHNGITYYHIDDSITTPVTYFCAVEDVDFNGKSKIHLENVTSATAQ